MAGDSDPATREQWIAGLFEAAGYQVSEEVGEHGAVLRFATLRSGVVRLRVVWTVTDAFPESVDLACDRLREQRVRCGADRGWLIVWRDPEPDAHHADLHGERESVVTRRRLALEVLGAFEALSEHAARWEREGRHSAYVRRRAATSDGGEVDACDAVVEWASRGSGDLLLVGDASECDAVVGQAIWKLAGAEARQPIGMLLRARAAWVRWLSEWAAFAPGEEGAGAFADARSLRYAREVSPGRTEGVLSLLPPSDEDVCAAVAARIRQEEKRAAFTQAFRQWEEFREHVRHLPLHDTLVASIEAVEGREGPSDEWVASVCVRFFRALLNRTDGEPSQRRRWGYLRGQLERAAFELSSLGDSSVLDEWDRFESHPLAVLPRYWFRDRSGKEVGWGRSIPNRLLRDYLVARWVVRSQRDERTPVPIGHVFPERWVLLFVALIAPEVAARLSADRGEEQRKQMEAEIERRVQLTFAHLLKRSAGAVTAHLETIEEHLLATSDELPGSVRTSLDRLRQEVGFQRRLAERSRVLHDAKGAELVEMPLAPRLETVLATLRREHARVDWVVDVKEGLTIRAFDDAAHEMLHCVIENAAHAALCHPPSGAPRVEVSALREGDTVVVLVRDHGGGVRAEDRERIFDPLVTTKKGGALPMGTGFGLAIARRYASLCGARVTLLDGAPTTFELRFVAGARA